jgi:hypothetical protein
VDDENTIDQRYQRWRASVPWTDDQIACAIEEQASHLPLGPMRSTMILAAADVRDGERISIKIFSWAVPVLVTTCGICGKPAMYRMGTIGRCSAHRDVPTKGFLHRRRTFDARRGYVEHVRDEHDRRGKAQVRLTRLHQTNRQKA